MNHSTKRTWSKLTSPLSHERCLLWLPDFPLSATGRASDGLTVARMRSFREAAQWVWRLPYGRNSRRDLMSVVLEGRGTCSTKHALLAQCAAEHDVDVELVLVSYIMTPRNTPAIAGVLMDSGLPGILEAHCLLRWHHAYVDLTFPGTTRLWTDADFVCQQVIAPADIGQYKINFHRQQLEQWARHSTRRRSMAELWDIRERCITALASGSARA